jgi:IS4 transposase
VTVRISTGRVLILVTNDLKAPATEIADLYKARWEIELFFKWIKQNLKLQRFLGSSKNAITLQIIAALIAYLLVRLAQLRARSALSTQAAGRSMPCSNHHLCQSAKPHTNSSLWHCHDHSGQQWVKPGHDSVEGSAVMDSGFALTRAPE